MKCVIRILEARDVKSLASIEKECFESPRSYKSLMADFESPLSFYLVATLEDGRVAGYIGTQEVCGESNIHNLAVRPAYRRQGIGRALLDKACEAAKARACDFITLEVCAGNIAAINLYKEKGFEIVGKRYDYYAKPREDALIMTKYFKYSASERED
ncbi:MAG: ribosomal protein S18-alanine N-acetyltransferase [Clostridiales bacterium]|nr:ribosomal protein S18-alanine N-acetyltransferase [Clostridiales bacterium]